MRNPTTPQLILLKAAHHRADATVPSKAFAYAGVFRPYGGTERIQAALRQAAKCRSASAAEKVLLDKLDFGDLLMAGGFLGVKRDSFRDGKGDLAERYVAAIRAGEDRIEGTNLASLRACIRAGWLTERWEITDDGIAAGARVDPAAFRPRYAVLWHERCYDRATEIDAATPDLTRAAGELVAEAYAEALEAHRLLHPGAENFRTDDERPPVAEPQPTGDRAGAGKTSLVREILEQLDASPDMVLVALDGKTEGYDEASTYALLTAARAEMMRRRPHAWLMIVPDEGRALTQGVTLFYMDDDKISDVVPRLRAKGAIMDPAVAGAMAGYKTAELSPSELNAIGDGISPAEHRRLYPAVTGDLIDGLLPRIEAIRDQVVQRLTELGCPAEASALRGDPREPGYRVTVTRIRRGHLSEAIRMSLFHLEVTLNVIVGSDGVAAIRSLDKAAAVLS
jgi:hypothetical protein